MNAQYFSSAIPIFEELTLKFPNNPKSWVGRAHSLMKLYQQKQPQQQHMSIEEYAKFNKEYKDNQLIIIDALSKAIALDNDEYYEFLTPIYEYLSHIYYTQQQYYLAIPLLVRLVSSKNNLDAIQVKTQILNNAMVLSVS